MICKICGSKYVVNKFYGLCKRCNDIRLRGPDFLLEKARKSILEDEIFYKKIFDASDHKCEECGKSLNTEFRDFEGRIIARWRYSHILPKSIYPEFRHEELNINNLCFECHQEWENGDKQSMMIYLTNQKRIEIMKERKK